MNGKPPSGSNNVPGIGVGYMPQVAIVIFIYKIQININLTQDLSLYNELNLREALFYFGKMYGLTKDELTSRMKLMVDFLDLPDIDRIIDNMRY